MIIAIANNKGGSGKSTTCANLGAALALDGKRVLLVDGDMQMNLSLSFFDEEEVLGFSSGTDNLLGYLQGSCKADAAVRHTRLENLFLLPSCAAMSGLEGWLAGKRGSRTVLSKKLAAVKDDYDCILIDAPPTLGRWTEAILTAADRLIIPVEAAPWGLFGLANLFDFLHGVQKNAPVTLLGVLVTKVDERKGYYRQTMDTLADLPDIPVFSSVIHVDSSVEWAQDVSRTVVEYKKSSRSAREYRALAKEVSALCR